MAKFTTAGAPGLRSPRKAPFPDRGPPSARALRRGPRPAVNGSPRRRSAFTSTTRRTASPTRRCGLPVRAGPNSPGSSGTGTRCSQARRSTSPRTGRYCTSPCACRRARSLVVDGVDVVAEVHEVLDRMAGFRRPDPLGGVEGPHRANRSATSSTSASAAPTSAPSWLTRLCATTAAARTDLPLCLERRLAPISSKPPGICPPTRPSSSSRPRPSGPWRP